MRDVFAVVVLGGLLLAGCAVQRAQTASRARGELVGMSKVDLLSCAGVPARQERTGGLEFLTYSSGGDSVGAAVVSQTSPSSGLAITRSARRYCEATFVLSDDIVQRVNYHGRTGGALTRDEQCAFVVENCLRR